MDQYNMNPMNPEPYIPQTPKKKGGFGKILITFLFTAILVGSNVYWWQIGASNDKIDSVINNQNTKIQEMSVTLEKLSGSLLGTQSEIKKNTTPTEDSSKSTEGKDTPKAQAYFDKCGSTSLFETETWFEDWKKAIIEIPRSNAMDPVALEGKITLNSVSDMCFSSRLQIIIALITGDEKGQGFRLLRYDIKEKTINTAMREDFEGNDKSLWYQWHLKRNNTPVEKDGKKYFPWFYPPTQFGTRENNLLLLTSTSKDKDCSNNYEYAYDIEKNYLFLRNLCQTCGDIPPSCSDLSTQQ